MKRKISNMVIVITGASSGIGRTTAIEIAQRHGTLVLAARSQQDLEEVVRECERVGGRAIAVATDVTKESDVNAVARKAVETFGRIDGWLNAAAVYLVGKFEEVPSDAFRRVIDTNFFGTVNAARTVLPYFREQGHGVLINIASVLGKIGAPSTSPYVASKFAVAGFSESLRMELRHDPNIHVCTVLPATIDTPLFQHAGNFSGRSIQAPPPVFPPEEAAEVIISCFMHPKREVTVGNAQRMIMMRQMAPALAEKVIAAKLEKDQFRNQPASQSSGNMFDSMPQFNAVHGGWSNGAPRRKTKLMTACTVALAAGAGFLAYRRRTHRAGLTRPLHRVA